MKYIYIIITITLLVSCKENTVRNKSHDTLQKKHYLTGKKLNINQDKLSSTGKLILFEKESCIIKENNRGEHMLEKIYYNKDSLIYLAKIGNGPNEFLQTRLIGKTSDKTYDIIDIKTNKISTYNLSDSIIKSIKLDKFTLDAISTTDGYIGTGCFEEIDKNDHSRFSVFDHYGKFTNSFGKFPNDGNNSPNSSKLLAYQGKYSYNSLLNRFAYISRAGIIFEIYQLNKETPLLVKYHHELFPSYVNNNSGSKIQAVHKKDQTFGYTDICSTDKFIYALYSGKKPHEHKKDGVEAAERSKEIHVFNWDGEKICSYNTNIELLNIAVSSNDKQIIAIAWDNDYILYSFDLPNI